MTTSCLPNGFTGIETEWLINCPSWAITQTSIFVTGAISEDAGNENVVTVGTLMSVTGSRPQWIITPLVTTWDLNRSKNLVKKTHIMINCIWA